jgi:hypothetical protein
MAVKVLHQKEEAGSGRLGPKQIAFENLSLSKLTVIAEVKTRLTLQFGATASSQPGGLP